MKVQIIPDTDDCLECPNCPAEDTPPSDTCINCVNNPEHVGEVIQFLMHEGTAYAVVLMDDDQFYLADINNIRHIKGG